MQNQISFTIFTFFIAKRDEKEDFSPQFAKNPQKSVFSRYALKKRAPNGVASPRRCGKVPQDHSPFPHWQDPPPVAAPSKSAGAPPCKKHPTRRACPAPHAHVPSAPFRQAPIGHADRKAHLCAFPPRTRTLPARFARERQANFHLPPENFPASEADPSTVPSCSAFATPGAAAVGK